MMLRDCVMESNITEKERKLFLISNSECRNSESQNWDFDKFTQQRIERSEGCGGLRVKLKDLDSS